MPSKPNFCHGRRNQTVHHQLLQDHCPWSDIPRAFEIHPKQTNPEIELEITKVHCLQEAVSHNLVFKKATESYNLQFESHARTMANFDRYMLRPQRVTYPKKPNLTNQQQQQPQEVAIARQQQIPPNQRQSELLPQLPRSASACQQEPTQTTTHQPEPMLRHHFAFPVVTIALTRTVPIRWTITLVKRPSSHCSHESSHRTMRLRQHVRYLLPQLPKCPSLIPPDRVSCSTYRCYSRFPH